MWVFMGVYDPTLKRSREFFGELGAICGLWNGPWCIKGDFHVTRFPSECSRGGRIALAMRKFSKLIDELDLRDLSLQGGSVYLEWWVERAIYVKIGLFSGF